MRGTDFFLGCFTSGVLTGEMVATMADKPIILALANPEPEIRPEVAKAAAGFGVATRPTADPPAYRLQLNNLAYHTGLMMAPGLSIAKCAPKRVAYAEGEE